MLLKPCHGWSMYTLMSGLISLVLELVLVVEVNTAFEAETNMRDLNLFKLVNASLLIDMDYMIMWIIIIGWHAYEL